MTTLPRGGNVPVAVDTVQVVLGWTDGPVPHDIDLSCLLLDGSGRVRDDGDFIFFNQPVHGSGAVGHHGRAGSSERLQLDLAAVPGGVETLVLAGSVADGTFGRVADLALAVADGSGRELLRFDAMGASDETAFVIGEFYRRDGGWKFRAVGQGWDAGLAALAMHYGVTVSENAEAEDVLPDVPADVPPEDVQPEVVEESSREPAGVLEPDPTPEPVRVPEPAAESAVRRPVVRGARHRSQTALDTPVTLTAGQVAAVTQDGKSLPHLWLRLSRANGDGPVIDASVLLYDRYGSPHEVVHGGAPVGAGGPVRLVARPVGDDLADTAAVELRLAELPESAAALVVAAHSASGEGLSAAGTLVGELVDPAGTLLARLEAPAQRSNAALLLSLVRDEGAWYVEVLGAPASGRTPASLLGAGHWALVAV